MVIAISGLPGSGKSYFASQLAKRLGACYLSSDIIRKEIQQQPGYSPAEKETVYDEMLERCRAAMAEAKPVVLDATFHNRLQRQRFSKAIVSRGQDWHLIYITADEDVITQRLAKNRPHSDAGFQVYKKLKAEFDPIEHHHLELHSGEDNIEQMLRDALAHINKA